MTDPQNSVAARLVDRALAPRSATYADEIRRLLDAALTVMRDLGPTGRPRVADIVAAAGLSNEAFYRHFPSKDALVAAILDDGTERLTSYLAHQMAKEPLADDQVRRWVEGVQAQADGATAAATLSVLANASSANGGIASGRHPASGPLAGLLRGPFTALGSADPELDATLAAHAVLGRLSDHLWQGTRADEREVERMITTCLAMATPPGRR